MLPELEVLDGLDPEGNEVNSENEQEAEEYDIGDRADGGDVISGDEEEDDGEASAESEGDSNQEGGMYSDEPESECSDESSSRSHQEEDIEEETRVGKKRRSVAGEEGPPRKRIDIGSSFSSEIPFPILKILLIKLYILTGIK